MEIPPAEQHFGHGTTLSSNQSDIDASYGQNSLGTQPKTGAGRGSGWTGEGDGLFRWAGGPCATGGITLNRGASTSRKGMGAGAALEAVLAPSVRRPRRGWEGRGEQRWDVGSSSRAAGTWPSESGWDQHADFERGREKIAAEASAIRTKLVKGCAIHRAAIWGNPSRRTRAYNRGIPIFAPPLFHGQREWDQRVTTTEHVGNGFGGVSCQNCIAGTAVNLPQNLVRNLGLRKLRSSKTRVFQRAAKIWQKSAGPNGERTARKRLDLRFCDPHRRSGPPKGPPGGAVGASANSFICPPGSCAVGGQTEHSRMLTFSGIPR